jgi:CRISPR-associated protein Cas1
MRKLLNTLFILSENSYLSVEGENIVITIDHDKKGRFPLHTLDSILYFGYKGASPSLMGACAKRNISLSFISPRGRFLARVCGESHGNVLLRKAQYRISDNSNDSCEIARRFIAAKLYNARWLLERATRDHPQRIDSAKIKEVSLKLAESYRKAEVTETLEELRGIEGEAAVRYFDVLDDLILQNKAEFYFKNRNRRPPLDKVNAMLSFTYSILGNDCSSALESVGLDAYVGFLHRDRPGRTSLGLDLMEELRPAFADRFVLTCINNRIIKPDYFDVKENGAVTMTDEGRKSFLNAYQQRKQEMIKHPFLDEKIPWGLVPYIQALLLARYLRGDLDSYPPFLWK